MSDIKLNTDTLRYYGNQLISISGRVVDVNLKLKSLYWSVPLVDLGKLLRADMLADFNASLIGAANYCYGTADEFDNLETKLCSQNPLDFNKPPLVGIDEFWYDVKLALGCAVQSTIEIIEVVDSVRKQIANEVINYVSDHAMDIVGVVCAVVTVVAAAALIAGGGPLAVFGVVMLVYALNDLVSSGSHLFGEDINILQSGFIAACGGNQEMGERIYSGTHLAVSVASLAVGGGLGASSAVAKTGMVASKSSKLVNAINKTNAACESVKKIKAVKTVDNALAGKGIIEDFSKSALNVDLAKINDALISGVINIGMRTSPVGILAL